MCSVPRVPTMEALLNICVCVYMYYQGCIIDIEDPCHMKGLFSTLELLTIYVDITQLRSEARFWEVSNPNSKIEVIKYLIKKEAATWQTLTIQTRERDDLMDSSLVCTCGSSGFVFL